ncbi:hypothetical protein Daus18300_011082 [Diaporthe australafricana]|uniref:C2H2-type domain-containing protein n=1 Tax=Diaporthe australafricana TaxID=127596 RepID=A0ABR3W824_9PEZI
MERILSAPDHHLRAVLLALCREPATELRIVKHLKALQDAAQTVPTNGKRKEHPDSLTFICIQCDKVFNEEENSPSSCLYHDGKREADHDEDFWADHDEDCHGVIEDLEDEFPEGFLWDCCQKRGDDLVGCVRGYHHAGQGKRFKLPGSPDLSTQPASGSNYEERTQIKSSDDGPEDSEDEYSG